MRGTAFRRAMHVAALFVTLGAHDAFAVVVSAPYRTSAEARAAAEAAASRMEEARGRKDSIARRLGEVRTRRMNLVVNRPAINAIDNNVAQARSQIGSLIQQRDSALLDLRSGFYCDKCGRTKTEIEKAGESFYGHLQKVGGRAVPAPQEKIDEKEREFNQKIAQLQDKIKQLESRRAQVVKEYWDEIAELDREEYQLQSDWYGAENELSRLYSEKARAVYWASSLRRDEEAKARLEEQRRKEELRRRLLEEERARREAEMKEAARRREQERKERLAEQENAERAYQEALALRRELEELRRERARREEAARLAREAYERQRREEEEAALRAAQVENERLNRLAEELRRDAAATPQHGPESAPPAPSPPELPGAPAPAGPPETSQPSDLNEAVDNLEDAGGGDSWAGRLTGAWAQAGQSLREARNRVRDAVAERANEEIVYKLVPKMVAEGQVPQPDLKAAFNSVLGTEVRKGLGNLRRSIIEGDTTAGLPPRDKAYRRLWETASQIDVPHRYLPRLLKSAGTYFGLIYDDVFGDGSNQDDGGLMPVEEK